MRKTFQIIVAIALTGYVFVTAAVYASSRLASDPRLQAGVSDSIASEVQEAVPLVDTATEVKQSPTEQQVSDPGTQTQISPPDQVSTESPASPSASTSNTLDSSSQNKPIAPTTPQLPADACIVTIFGSQYNVSSLRNTHSGGDVFVCGTDMSSIYKSQHGTDTQLIARYKI